MGWEYGQARGAGRSPSDPAALFAAARRHHQAGQFAPAQDLYRQVLAADPHHLGSLYHLGILAIQTGRHSDALALLGRVVAANEGAPDAHYHLALALQSGRRLAEAAAHYRRAAALKPDYAE